LEQEALDGLEFAKGSSSSKWGSLRASMGHPDPFDLRIVAIGNEECAMSKYRGIYFYFLSFMSSFTKQTNELVVLLHRKLHQVL